MNLQKKLREKKCVTSAPEVKNNIAREVILHFSLSLKKIKVCKKFSTEIMLPVFKKGRWRMLH